MSCIPAIGKHTFFGPEYDVVLPRSLPDWTKSKMNRLTAFALDSDPAVRAVAAAHPKTRPALLLGLMMDEDVHVRRAAIKNQKVTSDMMRVALQDVDPGIRAYAKLLQGGKNAD